MADKKQGVFWPIFLAIAAVSCAVVWKYAPTFRSDLPEGLRMWCRNATLRVQGREVPRAVVTVVDIDPSTGRPVDDGAVSVAQTRRMAAGDVVRDTGIGIKATEKIDAATLPSLKGIMQADPKRAVWGVTGKTTDIETLRGVDKGTVKGGRFFIIERRVRSEAGLMFVGNFWPKKLAEPVQVLAESLYCFSGRPHDLTEKQQQDLRTYYELRGEALELKAKLTKRQYDENDNPLPQVDPMTDETYRELVARMTRAAAAIPGLAF